MQERAGAAMILLIVASASSGFYFPGMPKAALVHGPAVLRSQKKSAGSSFARLVAGSRQQNPRRRTAGHAVSAWQKLRKIKIGRQTSVMDGLCRALRLTD
jgi:hypothetical protein